ncbi:MAG: hypothetical protein U0073_10865 [Bacteroidia bacterium]
MKYIIFFIMVFAACQSETQNKEETIEDQNRIDHYKSPEENKENQNLNTSSFTSDDNTQSYNENTNDGQASEIEDGDHQADVQYFNPNTGTRSTYTLTVEVENGEIVKIYWPNGGWLDESHFTATELDEDGSASFTSDKGYEYTVTITDFYPQEDVQSDNTNTDDNSEEEE